MRARSTPLGPTGREGLLLSLATSLKSARDIFATPPILVPFPPVLESYIEVVINNPALHRAVVNSVIISVGAVIFTLLLATPAAYALARLRLRLTALVVIILLDECCKVQAHNSLMRP